jgi:hypothetical protein
MLYKLFDWFAGSCFLTYIDICRLSFIGICFVPQELKLQTFSLLLRYVPSSPCNHEGHSKASNLLIKGYWSCSCCHGTLMYWRSWFSGNGAETGGGWWCWNCTRLLRIIEYITKTFFGMHSKAPSINHTHNCAQAEKYQEGLLRTCLMICIQ